MDIQKEKNLYLAKLLEQEVIKQDEFDDLVFKPEINAFHSNYLSSRFMDNINFGWSAWQAAKAQAVPEGFGDIQSWIAVNSFSALDASIVDFPVVDANELAEFIDSLNIDVAVPEGFVLVKKELPEQIAEKMAIDRIDKPRHENDPVWREIAEQSYKDQVKSKKWEFWRDYKAMIEAQEQSHE